MSEPWRELLRGVVHPWHHDQFGHMNVRWYAHFFDDAAFHLWPEFGVSLQRMEHDYGVHSVTARASTRFARELVGGDLIRIEGAVSRIGTKSVSFLLSMRHVDTGEEHAACEVVEVFFDPNTRKSAPIPDEVKSALQAFLIPAER